jgi:hypothetical protein
MKRAYFIILAGLIAVSAIFITGCKDERTKISSIINNPNKYMDRKVTVGGEVTKTYGIDLVLTEAGVYQIDDGTGKIWIITKNGVPRVGHKVGLKGTVSQGIRIGHDMIGAVVRESERRTR